MPAEALRRMVATVRSRRPAADLSGLTARERETLALFARGMSYREIAEIRGNRPLTVRNAIYAIRNKLKVRTRQELVVQAVLGGLLDQ